MSKKLLETGAEARQRHDYQLIADMVKPGSKVLDIGCNDGNLLEFLRDERKVNGRGVEISQKKVNICVARGLSVIQGDADRDLVDRADLVHRQQRGTLHGLEA